MHIIGDIAVLSTVVALLVNSLDIISHMPKFDISDYPMINSQWSKILGMAVSTLEGVGVILPIKENMKDKQHFNKIVYIGMVIVVIIVSGFPLIAYFSYKDATPEVFFFKLDSNHSIAVQQDIYSSCDGSYDILYNCGLPSSTEPGL